MSSSRCPKAPAKAGTLSVRTFRLRSGTKLIRFHKAPFPANSFNPNTGRKIEVPEDGARFNPFPGAPAVNVPTLYSATSRTAAALESVFHAVPHVNSARFPASQLADWYYSEIETTRPLVLLKLVTPNLRQLPVRGRKTSLTESELIHSLPAQYPRTRTWARFLHASLSGLDGLAWRPRLAGTATAFVFFGDRFKSGDLKLRGAAVPVGSGPGLAQIKRIATNANIVIDYP